MAVAEAGATVTLVARSIDQLQQVRAEIDAAGGTAEVLAADLSDLSSIPRLAREIAAAPVHGIVHAAGIQHRADAVSFPYEDIRRVLAVNLEAPLILSRELAAAREADSPRSSHVFIGSLGSSIAIPRAVAYAASKSAVLGVVRTLSAEWAGQGIRVNTLSPGYFLTELTADLLEDPVQEQRVLSRIPMGRLGRPDELGGAAVFLLSDAASYVTGQQIVVDGGWLGS
jgi:2-deoxy-D-gluconate 3-dehydrogenase